jgi:hypothetical protein
MMARSVRLYVVEYCIDKSSNIYLTRSSLGRRAKPCGADDVDALFMARLVVGISP